MSFERMYVTVIAAYIGTVEAYFYSIMRIYYCIRMLEIASDSDPDTLFGAGLRDLRMRTANETEAAGRSRNVRII